MKTILFALITGSLTSSMAVAETAPTLPVLRASDSWEMEVIGNGIVEAIPDQVKINISVSSEDADRSKAVSSVRNQAFEMKKRIKLAGAQEKDIRQFYVTLAEVHRKDMNGQIIEPQEVVGFEAQLNYVVSIKDTKTAADVIEAAIKSDSVKIWGHYSDFSNPMGMAMEAKAAAMRDARETAEVYAAIGDFEIRGISKMTEIDNGMVDVVTIRDQIRSQTYNAPVYISTGEVSSTISVIYEFTPKRQ